MANTNARMLSGKKGAGNPAPLPKQLRRETRKQERTATFMAALPFIGFLVFSLFPMGLSFIVSFTDLNTYQLDQMQFVGWDNLFKNFKTVLDNPETWLALKNSLIYCISVPITVFISTLLAHVTSRELPGTKVMKVILFIPSVCIGTAVSFMWQWILADNVGMINSAIIGAGGENIGFMSTEQWFLPSIMLITVWKNATNILVMQAAFSNVSPTLKEAARIDGASEMHVFWKVTFPMITPQIFYLLIMSFISAMQEQGIMQIVTNGGVGPNYAGLTLSYQVYRLAFGAGGASNGMGVGSALSWLIAIMIMIITKLLFKAQDRWAQYED